MLATSGTSCRPRSSGCRAGGSAWPQTEVAAVSCEDDHQRDALQRQRGVPQPAVHVQRGTGAVVSEFLTAL